jgi:hypothetical protein
MLVLLAWPLKVWRAQLLRKVRSHHENRRANRRGVALQRF